MTSPTILVVDANPATVRRVTAALAGNGCVVAGARDTTEATSALASRSVAMVLASAALPLGSGYELAQSVKSARPDLPVALMTGGFDVYDEGRARVVGVVGHLSKPIDLDEVRALVSAHVSAAGEGAGDGPLRAATAAPPSASTEERYATMIPRSYQDVPIVAVDPEVVAPALERAILDVLPEVVEAVIQNAISGSPAFRELLSVAVEDAVQAQLPAIASRVVEERLAQIESSLPQEG